MAPPGETVRVEASEARLSQRPRRAKEAAKKDPNLLLLLLLLLNLKDLFLLLFFLAPLVSSAFFLSFFLSLFSVVIAKICHLVIVIVTYGQNRKKSKFIKRNGSVIKFYSGDDGCKV